MESKDNAPFFDLPNGEVTRNCHNNESVRAANPNKHGATNTAAKQAPSLAQAMEGMTRYKGM